MPITGLIRSIRKKVFLTLAAFCLVGVLSASPWAAAATTHQPDAETPAAAAPNSSPPGKIERAGQATGRGIERAFNATKRGVKRACEATGKGVKKAGAKIEKTFSGNP